MTADPNFTILYVDSPAKSAQFYTQLLGKTPAEASPTFVLFALEGGATLGLWSKHTVKPQVTVSPDTKSTTQPAWGELVFPMPHQEAVADTYTNWMHLHIPIVQEPTQMEFGYTFLAQDPDGHRLRVFTPSGT